MRNQLCGVDHNRGLKRKIHITRMGTEQVRKFYSKGSGQWKAQYVYEPKKDEWRKEFFAIADRIKKEELKRGVHAKRKKRFRYGPRNIAPVPAPPDEVLMKALKKRRKNE